MAAAVIERHPAMGVNQSPTKPLKRLEPNGYGGRVKRSGGDKTGRTTPKPGGMGCAALNKSGRTEFRLK